MILGFLYILAGVVLFIFPQLLAFFVAALFILIGAVIMYISLYYRRMARRFDDPIMDFIFRL
ncbi:MAG TPA: hypothetical protein PKO44_02475 [Candidatus Omnitrophota bacterium]|nr:hypothetical protein [Candidatus Omnitrophota bacterium]